MKRTMISVISALTGAAAGAGAVRQILIGEKEKVKVMSDKHLALFLLMNQWVKVKQEGKNLSEYLEKNEYQRIAVYGMSYVGETLIDELKGTHIDVAYGIDRNADGIYADMDMFTVDDNLDDVDAVIVTAITSFDEIEQKLSEKMDCPIISLEDILYEL